jgi:hypothetical protein
VDHVKITDMKLWEAQNAVVADPELEGCALRDSGGRLRIARQVCPFGNDRAASMGRDIAYYEAGMAFYELCRGTVYLEPHRVSQRP